jgi:hypothetical protein
MLASLEQLGAGPGPLTDLVARQLSAYAAQEPAARPLVLRRGAVLLARLGQARHMGPLLARVERQALEELRPGPPRPPYLAPQGSRDWWLMQQEPMRTIMASWPARPLLNTEMARLMGEPDWAFVDNERHASQDPTVQEEEVNDMAAPTAMDAAQQLELLWCLAAARAQHEPAPELVELLLEGAEARLEALLPLGLPALAAACGGLGLRQRAPLLLLAARELGGRCGELAPAQLADLVWGLAQLAASPGALLREVADSAMARVSELRPGEMARLAAGFAMFWRARAFPSPPRRLMDALGAEARGRLGAFSGPELAELLWALAQMGLGEEGGLAAALVEAAAPRAGELRAGELLRVLGALAALELCPEDLLAALDLQLASAWARQQERRRRRLGEEERRQAQQEEGEEEDEEEEDEEEEDEDEEEEDWEAAAEEREAHREQQLQLGELVACLQHYSSLLYLPQSLEELLQGQLAGALQQAEAEGAGQLGLQLAQQLAGALQAYAEVGSAPRQLLAALQEHQRPAASALQHLAPAQAVGLAYALVVFKAYDLPLMQQLAAQLPALLEPEDGAGLGGAGLLQLGAALAVAEAEGGPRLAVPGRLAAAAAAALQQHLAEPADPDMVDLAAALAADISGRATAVDVPAGPGVVASADVVLQGRLSVSGSRLALQLLRESEEVLPDFGPSGLAQLGARLLARQGWEVVHVSALALGTAGPDGARRYMEQALASSGLLL